MFRRNKGGEIARAVIIYKLWQFDRRSTRHVIEKLVAVIPAFVGLCGRAIKLSAPPRPASLDPRMSPSRTVSARTIHLHGFVERSGKIHKRARVGNDERSVESTPARPPVRPVLKTHRQVTFEAEQYVVFSVNVTTGCRNLQLARPSRRPGRGHRASSTDRRAVAVLKSRCGSELPEAAVSRNSSLTQTIPGRSEISVAGMVRR